MRIYFIRHGQSEANISGNHNSPYTPLTHVGQVQAERIANFFKDKNIGKIFSSDLVRAKDTAEKISKAISVPVKFLEDLREINRGVFEGKPRIETKNAIKGSKKNHLDFRPEKGENYYDAYNRVNRLVKKLKSEEFCENIVVVSHGGIIALSLVCLLNISIEEIKYIGIKNGSISLIDLDKKGNVIKFKVNTLSHIVKVSKI